MSSTTRELQRPPFSNSLDPRGFHESPTHVEALARLHFLVEQRRRLGLLTGDPGSGKSFLLEIFAQQLRRRGQPVAKVDLLGIDPAETLGLLAAELKLNLDPAAPVVRLWRGLTDRLVEHRYQGFDTVILLDDADRATASVLDLVSRLAVYDRTPAARLTLILAGQRTRISRLGDRLLGLAELRIDIEPWEASDTRAFLDEQLARSGRGPSLFADPAVDRLHELAHGVPRRVSQLADLALLAAAGDDLPQIDADTVESVYRELATIEA